MLGASLAQEIHALPQLELLYQGKRNLKDRFSDKDWQDVAYFYEIHLDGTEARHAEDLNRTIWDFIDSDEKRAKFQQGFNGLLSQLDLFWKGIAKKSNEINTLYFPKYFGWSDYSTAISNG